MGHEVHERGFLENRLHLVFTGKIVPQCDLFMIDGKLSRVFISLATMHHIKHDTQCN